MKVFLRIPTNQGIDQRLVPWLVWVARTLPSADINHQHTFAHGIAEGRNDIVKDFLNSDCTHLWMVDSDTIPPQSLDLLESGKAHSVVCGPVLSCHAGVLNWNVYKKKEAMDTEGDPLYRSIPRNEWPRDTNCFQVDVAGAACMLIQRDVLSKEVNKKPFYHERRNDGMLMGEDFMFCKDAGGAAVDKRYICRHNRNVELLEIKFATELQKIGR